MSSATSNKHKVSYTGTPAGPKALTSLSTPNSSCKRKGHAGLTDNAEVIPSTAQSTPRTTKRRKTKAVIDSGDVELVDLTMDELNASDLRSPSGKGKGKAKSASKNEEKRLRLFRKKPPQTYLEKLGRAQTQRMFVIDRIRRGTEDVPEEEVKIVGTTGNIYTVMIEKMPSCDCPDSQKGNQCKHIVYVLHNVLKAPEYLQYQLAFLSSELREIFQNVPLSPKENASTDEDSGKRKPIDGDCPICYMDFDEAHNELVWCKAACGNNIHKACFDQWAVSQGGNGVKCVYCRTPWQSDPDSMKDLSRDGKVNDEGYVNVADQLGLSGERDWSTYHQPWVRRQFFRYY